MSGHRHILNNFINGFVKSIRPRYVMRYTKADLQLNYFFLSVYNRYKVKSKAIPVKGLGGL
jgi:hypothetical protein